VIHPGRSLTIPPATRPLPTPQSLPAAAPAPRPTSRSIDTLTTFLRAQVGLPYRFFSAGPHSYDCSGLVVAAFRQVGVALPHQSRALAQRGTAVDWTTEAITAGDLVFTSAFDDPERITHVGIALDGRRWIQAIGPGRDVSIGFLPADARIMEVRRIDLP
jgi:cell wall-associated NlpC family hydrolase